MSLGLLWYYYSGAETQEGGAPDPELDQQVEELAQMVTTPPEQEELQDWIVCRMQVIGNLAALIQSWPTLPPRVGRSWSPAGACTSPGSTEQTACPRPNQQEVGVKEARKGLTSRRRGSRRHMGDLSSQIWRSRRVSHLDSQRWKTRCAKDLTSPAKPEGLLPKLASPPPEAVWSCACCATAACHADPLHHRHHWIRSRPPELTPPCRWARVRER